MFCVCNIGQTYRIYYVNLSQVADYFFIERSKNYLTDGVKFPSRLSTTAKQSTFCHVERLLFSKFPQLFDFLSVQRITLTLAFVSIIPTM